MDLDDVDNNNEVEEAHTVTKRNFLFKNYMTKNALVNTHWECKQTAENETNSWNVNKQLKCKQTAEIVNKQLKM